MNRNQTLALCIATFAIGHIQATVRERNLNKKESERLQKVHEIQGMRIKALRVFLTELVEKKGHDQVFALQRFQESTEFINIVNESSQE